MLQLAGTLHALTGRSTLRRRGLTLALRIVLVGPFTKNDLCIYGQPVLRLIFYSLKKLCSLSQTRFYSLR